MKRIIFVCAMLNILLSFAAAPMDVAKDTTILDKKAQAEAIDAHKKMMAAKMNGDAQDQAKIFAQLAQSSDEELRKDFEIKFIKSIGLKDGEAMTRAQQKLMEGMWQTFMISIKQQRTVVAANARHAGRIPNPQRITFGLWPESGPNTGK